jgi:hypothetical protein
MKIIISHDVDHIYSSDHFRDLYFPKLWVRNSMKLLKKEISVKEWYLRCSNISKKKMHCITELVEFEKMNNIPAEYFFGMANGQGLAYKQNIAAPLIKFVKDKGFDVGVHGIDFNSLEGIKKEFNDFILVTNIENFGIRMHYVNSSENTFNFLAQVGYLFDSSEFNKAEKYLIKKPYKIGDMWEFPLCLMDSYLPYDLDKAKEITKDIIDKAEKVKLPYFTLLFHDIYFCSAYNTYKEWYIWAINYFISNGYSFISYRQAIKELNGEKGVI